MHREAERALATVAWLHGWRSRAGQNRKIGGSLPDRHVVLHVPSKPAAAGAVPAARSGGSEQRSGTMPVTAPLFGAVLGVGVQLYVNAVRKLPLMRDPWLHVLWAGAGASFGTWLVSFEERTERDLAGEPPGGRRAAAAAAAGCGRRRPAAAYSRCAQHANLQRAWLRTYQ